MTKTITVAIPTFNRSTRLKKSLQDLLGHIIKAEISNLSNVISIYVSNNGSTDNTDDVLKNFKEIYEEVGV